MYDSIFGSVINRNASIYYYISIIVEIKYTIKNYCGIAYDCTQDLQIQLKYLVSYSKKINEGLETLNTNYFHLYWRMYEYAQFDRNFDIVICMSWNCWSKKKAPKQKTKPKSYFHHRVWILVMVFRLRCPRFLFDPWNGIHVIELIHCSNKHFLLWHTAFKTICA